MSRQSPPPQICGRSAHSSMAGGGPPPPSTPPPHSFLYPSTTDDLNKHTTPRQHPGQYVRKSVAVLVVHFTMLKTLLTDSSTLTCLILFLWDPLPFQKLKLLYFHQDGAPPYYILILLVKETSSQSWIGRRGLLRLGHNVHLSFKDFNLLRFC